jgi:hypothetical protein
MARETSGYLKALSPIGMADYKLIKRWKSTRRYLERARQLLPSPIRENDGAIPEYDLATLAAYGELLDHNELELALDRLDGLGELNDCPGGYWRNLFKAALLMGLNERAAALHRRFEIALGTRAQ